MVCSSKAASSFLPEVPCRDHLSAPSPAAAPSCLPQAPGDSPNQRHLIPHPHSGTNNGKEPAQPENWICFCLIPKKKKWRLPNCCLYKLTILTFLPATKWISYVISVLKAAECHRHWSWLQPFFFFHRIWICSDLAPHYWFLSVSNHHFVLFLLAHRPQPFGGQVPA